MGGASGYGSIHGMMSPVSASDNGVADSMDKIMAAIPDYDEVASWFVAEPKGKSMAAKGGKVEELRPVESLSRAVVRIPSPMLPAFSVAEIGPDCKMLEMECMLKRDFKACQVF